MITRCLLWVLSALLCPTVVWGAQVTVTWRDASIDESAFVMERCQTAGCVNYTTLTTTAPNVTTLIDTEVIVNETYCYRLKAINAAGASSYSNVACLTITPAVSTAALVCRWQPLNPAGLVAAYRFSEGAGTAVADASGNTNTGTLLGGTAWSPLGKFGGALSFNGTTGRVTIPASASLDLTTALTLEAWVYPVSLTTFHPVIMKEGAGLSPYGLYAYTNTKQSTGYVTLNGIMKGAYGAAVPLNTWTFLTVTYDGTTVRLYRNAALVASVVAAGALPRSTGLLQIGGNTQYGEAFAGRMDEVRVYNRPLSAAEIQTDMNREIQ